MKRTHGASVSVIRLGAAGLPRDRIIDLTQDLPAISSDEDMTVVVALRDGSHVVGALRLEVSPPGMSDAELSARISRLVDRPIHAFSGSEEPEHIPPKDSPPGPAAGRWPEFTVAVATRDRPHELRRALESIQSLEYPTFEIVVVDSGGPTSETKDVVISLSRHDDRFRYVCEPRAGLSRARNTALALASGSHVAFTDDDAVVDPHWLNALAKGFGEDDDAVCVTGLTLPAELRTQAQALWEEFGGHSKNRGFRPQSFRRRDAEQHPLYPVPAYGAGVNMAFELEYLRSVGGFDPALGAGTPTMSAEDTDAFAEVLILGRAIRYTPDALVWHFHRSTYDELRKQIYGNGVGLTAYFTKCFLQRPLDSLSLLGVVPQMLRYSLGAGSPRRVSRTSAYPNDLDRCQFRGLLFGPIAYFKSRRVVRGLGS